MASRDQAEFRRKAIDIVCSVCTGAVDPVPIIVGLAKHHPKALCAAAEFLPWEAEARSILAAEGIVPGIKFVRSKTQMSLKEAKDYLERMEAR